MAETVTWDRLRELAEFRAGRGAAISVYVDLDPTVSATAGEVDSRVNALLAEGEKSESASREELEHDEREALKADFNRIREFFENDFDRDGTSGVAVFAAGGGTLFSAISLPDPVPDDVKIRRELYLAPLVPLVGRGAGVLVAVVGREQGRLLRLRGGRLEEFDDRSEEQHGQHQQGGWSQARYQRHIEHLVQAHYRDVAEALDRHVRANPSLKLVIVGAEDTRSDFMDVLSNEARGAVVGAATAEAHASAAEILPVVEPVLEETRRAEEAAALDRWNEEAGRGARAASGWAATVEAASDGRVDVLLYRDGVDREVWQCPQCGRGAVEAGMCPLDGVPMARVEEGLDMVVHRTLAHGGTVLPVRDRPDLDRVEGIGALLRY